MATVREEPAVTRRRPRGRRDVILKAAANLFAERGVANTGMDEIGVAAGITGPAVYRHFKNKDAILVAIGERALEQFLPRMRSIAEAGDDPWVTLEHLVLNMIDAITADRTALAVLFSERKNLDPQFRAVVDRSHRLHMSEWVHLLSQVRPGVPDLDLQLAAGGVHGMLLTLCERDPGAGDERVRELYAGMAMAALRSV